MTPIFLRSTWYLTRSQCECLAKVSVRSLVESCPSTWAIDLSFGSSRSWPLSACSQLCASCPRLCVPLLEMELSPSMVSISPTSTTSPVSLILMKTQSLSGRRKKLPGKRSWLPLPSSERRTSSSLSSSVRSCTQSGQWSHPPPRNCSKIPTV